ncbi:XRE family transcriptional regulator [Cytobacillus oceanisediminis]
MPKVRISAARFGSLLTNRHLTPADVAERVKTDVSLDDLAGSDLDVELTDVVALAKVFKRPWSYLLIDEPEEFPSAGSDNRTFDNQKTALSPDLLTELQAADRMLQTAEELLPGSTYRVPAVAAGGSTSASQLAALTRTFLGVSVDDQLAVKDEFAALRVWVAAIHATGVYVAQRRLRDDTIRAFSKAVGDQAVIVVDTGDTAYARIFSALHEYCHVTLRSTGICDLDDHSAVERYCNAVAAGVLLPDELLDRVTGMQDFADGRESADEALKSLSRQLHVSQAALLIRLRDHGTITQDVYEAMELRRAARRGGGKKPGGTYYAPAINKVGRLYAHRVVDALTEGAIDRQDASALLGVGEHLMPTYLAELAKGD